MRYAVVIEKAGRNFSAYVPDLPGCIATGATIPAVERRIGEAITLHLRGMREDGVTPPKPMVRTKYIRARFTEIARPKVPRRRVA